ncbi:MAG: zinc-binding dehydrogenase [Betaproteobacteria bacterium]|nr:zinc-binding dehydrogenase [Betaproteobacteria bacterium]
MAIAADLMGRLAIYDAPNKPFEIRLFPVRAPRRDEVLVKIRMSTICRSDIHSYLGHRPNPCPGLLGHEIIGTILELGEGITHDMRGAPLQSGDRITWSEYFIPGNNYYTEVLDLPQKSPGVDKYGHMAVTTEPHHHGGFGEYCYVLPRSWILKLPDDLTDEEATPVNCGVATMVSVTEQAQVKLGDAVVIFGLGLLGLYGAALAKGRGARLVIGLDNVASRRELGLAFGCDHVFDPSSMPEAGLVEQVRALCRPEGADAVIEVCGYPEVAIPGLQFLRTGGRFVFGGTVNPGSNVTIDANMILRKLLTIRGVHNYHPRHLIEALDFVHGNRKRFPFHALVDGKYSLDQVGQAMKDAEDRKVLRAAIVP